MLITPERQYMDDLKVIVIAYLGPEVTKTRHHADNSTRKKSRTSEAINQNTGNLFTCSYYIAT